MKNENKIVISLILIVLVVGAIYVIRDSDSGQSMNREGTATTTTDERVEDKAQYAELLRGSDKVSSQNASRIIADINNNGSAPVIVRLRTNIEDISDPNISNSRKKEAINQAQDTLASSVTEEEFKFKIKYPLTPAVAGHVYPKGVSVLLSNPIVTNISYDGGGSGN